MFRQGTKTKLKKPLKATVFAQAITATGVSNMWTLSKAWSMWSMARFSRKAIGLVKKGATTM